MVHESLGIACQGALPGQCVGLGTGADSPLRSPSRAEHNVWHVVAAQWLWE